MELAKNKSLQYGDRFTVSLGWSDFTKQKELKLTI